jgi:hypothetical protein
MKEKLKSKAIKALILVCSFIQVHAGKSPKKQGVDSRIAVDGKEIFDRSVSLDADYDQMVKDSANPEVQSAFKNLKSGIKRGVDAEKALAKVTVEKCLTESNFRNILQFQFSVLARTSLLGRMIFTVDLTGLSKAPAMALYVMDLIKKTIVHSANTAFEIWEDTFVEFLGEKMAPLSDHYHTVSWNVDFQSKDIISLRENNRYYTGGAHGNSHTKCYTFWLTDGQPKPIKPEDLFQEGSDWPSVLNPFVGKVLLEQKKRKKAIQTASRKDKQRKEHRGAFEMAAIAASKNCIKVMAHQTQSSSMDFTAMETCQDAIEEYRMADAEYEKVAKGSIKTTENYRKIKEDCNKAIELFKNTKLVFDWNRLAEKVSISPKGITIYFDPYDVGCFAEGEYTVHVPFSVLETVLRKDGVMRALLDS